jgi:hypothetical protein
VLLVDQGAARLLGPSGPRDRDQEEIVQRRGGVRHVQSFDGARPAAAKAGQRPDYTSLRWSEVGPSAGDAPSATPAVTGETRARGPKSRSAARAAALDVGSVPTDRASVQEDL